MIRCKKCKEQNLEGTSYCQNCGSYIKKQASFFKGLDFNFLAGNGMKHNSIAPIAIMNIKKQPLNELGENIERSKQLIKVTPKPDASWYCPDCGHHNQPYGRSCTSCGREFT